MRHGFNEIKVATNHMDEQREHGLSKAAPT
jgi:hypothetical protein